METLENDGTAVALSPELKPALPRLRFSKILAISIFWFAQNVHWTALLLIIIPSQVFKLVGAQHQGEALAFILIPGAFISLFANPLFGLLSDRTRGRWARWGKRRPYILIGTLVNVVGLIWLAFAADIPSLAVAYALTQFSSNAAQAPFHALLPDVVPQEQRGLASGVMGMLTTLGVICGVLFGLLIDASKPLAIYQQSLHLVYAIIIIVLVLFMLITIFSVPERRVSADSDASENETASWRSWRPSRSMVLTLVGTIVGTLVVWGLIIGWNKLNIANIQLSSDVQQVLLELVVIVGILRLFDFNPRRDPDFAWVLVTRLVMMLGIYTVQDFLQFYMRDVVGAPHPEQQTTNFILIVAITGLASALVAGWLSDRFGRKRIVYVAGSFMSLVGVVFVITHSLPLVLAAGAIFGLGYGAYGSVDWALVADTLPSRQNFAKDMGIWNISLSLPQVLAPVVGGPLIDHFTHAGQPVVGFQILFGLAIIYCFLGTVTVRFIRGVR
ncbi:MAG TPA: MFS transporter [Ktedonobacteraceae bacterium]|nr:MFS transporter [Ktedonobacteraceae bacterium]